MKKDKIIRLNYLYIFVNEIKLSAVVLTLAPHDLLLIF